MVTAVKAEFSETTWLIELNFSGGVTRLCTAATDVDALGFTWEAVGGFISATSPVKESGDTKGEGVGLELSGVDQAISSKILSEFVIGRVAKIYLAHFDSAGAVVATPQLMFEGLMSDGFSINPSRTPEGESAGTVKIETRLISELARRLIRGGIQTNATSHGAVFSGDLGMEYVAGIVGKTFTWGKETVSASGNTFFQDDPNEDRRDEEDRGR